MVLREQLVMVPLCSGEGVGGGLQHLFRQGRAREWFKTAVVILIRRLRFGDLAEPPKLVPYLVWLLTGHATGISNPAKVAHYFSCRL